MSHYDNPRLGESRFSEPSLVSDSHPYSLTAPYPLSDFCMIGNRISHRRPILIADHPVGMAYLMDNWTSDRRATKSVGRLDDC